MNDKQYIDYFEDIKNRFGVGGDFVKIIICDKVAEGSVGEYKGYVGGRSTNSENFSLIFFSARYNFIDYIHELGHTQNLRHTFPEIGNTNTKINIGQTNNFMDYTNRKYYFWKWQGDLIRIINQKP